MNTFYRKYGKRILDLAIAIPGAVLLGPVVAVVALLIRIQIGSPVLFRQERGGHRGSHFTLTKFRTMFDRRDAEGQLLPDEQRLHSFGSWIRRLSLDELPQLWNVIRGDMSLVGPRPLFSSYLDRYTPEQARRHDVVPGITGWAQINGRNAISWEEKFSLDLWYVDHVSLKLDMEILWRTYLQVVSRKDVNTKGYATTYEFMGTQSER